MERFAFVKVSAKGPYLAEYAEGEWCRHSDARAALDAANKRADEAERRLALAVEEIKASRAAFVFVHTERCWVCSPENMLAVRATTDAEPELAKMIGGG